LAPHKDLTFEQNRNKLEKLSDYFRVHQDKIKNQNEKLMLETYVFRTLVMDASDRPSIEKTAGASVSGSMGEFPTGSRPRREKGDLFHEPGEKKPEHPSD
jgi:hypothetical protein